MTSARVLAVSSRQRDPHDPPFPKPEVVFYVHQRDLRVLPADDSSEGRICRKACSLSGLPVPVTIPAPEEPSIDLLDLSEEFPLDPPPTSAPSPLAAPQKVRGNSSATGSPWYVKQWHWLVVLAVLVLSLIPMAGFAIAVLVCLIGMGMAFIGGLVPIIRIIAGAPGTVLLMIVSRSARFEMMRQPDDHPYKVLVRNASKPTRGILWRGVLLMLVIVPAGYLHGFSMELFRHWGSNDTADVRPPPDPFRPGGMRPDGMQPGGPGIHGPAMVPSSGHGSSADGRPMPGEYTRAGAPNSATEPPSAGDTNQNSSANPLPGQPPIGPRGQPPRFGGPGPQPPFGGPGRQSGPPGMEDRILLILLSFDASNVTGDPFEFLESAVSRLPGYLPETFSMDDESDRAEFQHRGQFDPGELMRTMSANGFRAMRAQTRPVPGS